MKLHNEELLVHILLNKFYLYYHTLRYLKPSQFFWRAWYKFYKPMVAVPSSYSQTKESELIKAGFKVVIYANHMQRAAYPAMQEAAKLILKNKRSFELEKKISSVNEVINLIK